MAGMFVVHAANEAIFIRLGRQPGKVFADLDAGNTGGNGAKLAANVVGCLRFWVEGVELARSAE